MPSNGDAEGAESGGGGGGLDGGGPPHHRRRGQGEAALHGDQLVHQPFQISAATDEGLLMEDWSLNMEVLEETNRS